MNSETQPRSFSERDDWLRAVLATKLPHVAARVAIRIGLYLNVEFGLCNPGVKTIAEATNISERSVSRQLVLLERAGWIEIRRGGGRKRSNHYVLKYSDKALTGFNPENLVSGGKRTLSAVAQNAATTVADKKRLTAKRTRRNAFSVSPGERERSHSLAVSPDAPAPSGGAPNERFELLLSIWDRPYGNDRAAAWAAFIAIYTPAIDDEIIASACRWVAARPSEKLQKLETWLGNGAWKNLPPHKQPRGKSGKVSLADVMLRQGDKS
jgi:hypothetical protein